MRILLLSPASSIHTVRWANALAGEGVDVALATQHEALEPIAQEVRILRLPHSGGLGYFRNVPALKRILRNERPDLLNVHYASGYGTTARLAGFEPTLLSLWGSDVYDFPNTSALHRLWLRGNLMAATRVASTSHAMAGQARRIAPALGEIAVTPFGVETDRFVPAIVDDAAPDRPIVVGTVKALKSTYGIDLLIEAFALLVNGLAGEFPQISERLTLRIVGDGPQLETLGNMAAQRGVAKVTQFIPRVPHDEVPVELGKLDVYVALSRRESFGVAVIEAGACGLPVVVSDVGGLPEVVANGETGFVVPRENPQAAAEALRKLVLDAGLRRRMGDAARQRVTSLYEWRDNVRHMIGLYGEVIGRSRKGTPG